MVAAHNLRSREDAQRASEAAAAQAELEARAITTSATQAAGSAPKNGPLPLDLLRGARYHAAPSCVVAVVAIEADGVVVVCVCAWWQ